MKKFYLAAIISLLYIPIVTISAELVAPLKAFIKSIFWHHWFGKSVILIILFFVLSLIFSRSKNSSSAGEEKFLSVITWVAFASVVSIFLFFTYEYTKQF